MIGTITTHVTCVEEVEFTALVLCCVLWLCALSGMVGVDSGLHGGLLEGTVKFGLNLG